MTSQTFRLRLQRVNQLKLKVNARIPAQIEATAPILLNKTSGIYTFSLDMNAINDTIGVSFQPADADLTAIAALTTTAYGRSLLTLANATALAAEVDSFFLTPAEGNAAYQPLDSDLTAIAALTTTSYGRAFLALADAAAARTAIGVRDVLTANRTYYVRTDGSDSNTGLVNSAGGAFLTIQKAIDVIAALDIATYSVTISVAGGTYTGTIVVTGPWLGSGSVTLTGDTTTPSNVVLSTTGTTLSVTLGGRLNLGGFKIVSSAGIGISCAAGVINLTGNMDYGACSQGHINCSSLGQISITASYTISGSSSYHWGSAGNIAGSSLLWTLTGTPAFSTAFAYATSGGAIRTFSNTSSGSATGLRYLIDGGSSINTFGGGASYFPGGTAGSGGTTTGGGFYS